MMYAMPGNHTSRLEASQSFFQPINQNLPTTENIGTKLYAALSLHRKAYHRTQLTHDGSSHIVLIILL